MKKIMCMLLLMQGGFMIAQTKTVVSPYGEKIQINPYVNNGLEANNGYVQLGGPLTKPSVLNTTSDFTLAIEGLIAGSATDNILVVDSNNILRKVSASSLTVTDWNLLGNAGTDPALNFLGTTDNQPLQFKINNTNAGKVSTATTAFGYNALNPVSTGTANTAFGTSALAANTSGFSNTATGNFALSKNTTGGGNTAYGAQALRSNTTGTSNTAIGSGAMDLNDIGVANTAVGNSSLSKNSSGNYNTAMGWQSLVQNTTGTDNTAIGYQSGNNVTGNFNTSVGSNALQYGGAGINNTAVGANALKKNYGTGNAAFGYNALAANTTGNNNLSIGNSAGADITTGNNNIVLGGGANNAVSVSSPTASNEMNIGNTIYGTAVNNAIGTGKIGINTNAPTAAMDVNGYARVRTMDTGILTDNVVTVDSNGNLRKISQIDASAATLGFAKLGAGADLVPYGAYIYTGTTITLPPGKWLVSINMLATKSSGSLSATGSDESWWIRSGFSDTSTSYVSSTDIISTNSLVSGLLPPSSYYAMNMGTVIINNTSGANKIYYYWAGNAWCVNGAGTVLKYGGSNWGEDYITFQKIN